jgi:hypothetical protein
MPLWRLFGSQDALNGRAGSANCQTRQSEENALQVPECRARNLIVFTFFGNPYFRSMEAQLQPASPSNPVPPDSIADLAPPGAAHGQAYALSEPSRIAEPRSGENGNDISADEGSKWRIDWPWPKWSIIAYAANCEELANTGTEDMDNYSLCCHLCRSCGGHYHTPRQIAHSDRLRPHPVQHHRRIWA